MGIKLVIVDDAPFIREAIRGIVKDSQLEIIAEASDGEEAVRVVRELKPEVVLMDMVLPKKNGIEATIEILENDPTMKIVACSTEGQQGLLLRALNAGCVSYIAKPFNAEDLLRVLLAAGQSSNID